MTFMLIIEVLKFWGLVVKKKKKQGRMLGKIKPDYDSFVLDLVVGGSRLCLVSKNLKKNISERK